MAAQSASVTPSATLSALGALSIADSNTAISSTNASVTTDIRLPNFSLPRELRDHIYGYLLHNDYTRITRKRKTASDDNKGSFSSQAYKFHTNILAVNNVIHDETEEYLYKNNVFVVASAEWHESGFWPGESVFNTNAWTPMITDKRAAKMRHHSLRLHFGKGETAKYSYLEACMGRKEPMRSCLILAKDLYALVTTMRIQVLEYQGFAVTVEDDYIPPALNIVGWNDQEDKPQKPTRFKVQFIDTPYRTVDAKLQSEMLGLLRDIACSGMRVTFDGVLPEHGDHVQHMKDVMTAVLINRHPADWIRYETFRSAKQLADDAMRVGELHLAEEMLLSLLADTAGYLHALTLPAPGSPPQAVSPQHTFWPAVEPLHILRLDIVLTLGYLQLKLGLLQRLQITAGQYLGMRDETGTFLEEFDPGSSNQFSQVGSATSDFTILCCVYLPRYPDATGHSPKMSVGSMMKALQKHKHFPHQAHDLAILSKVPNKKALALKHLPLDKCSVSVFGLRHFDFHKSPGVPRKPDNIVGLQNLDVLSRLDQQTKQGINELQRIHEQKLTQWQ